MGEALDRIVLHGEQVSVAMRIRQATVFGETFSVVASLVVMESASITTVVPGEDFALVVESDTESIAASFCEYLVLMGLWMVSPDRLSEALDRFFGGAVGADCAADCGALCAI